MKYRIYIFTLIVLLSSCKSRENTIDTKEKLLTENTEIKSIYYFIEVTKEAEQIYNFRLVKQKPTTAKIKGVFRKKIPENQLENKHWLVSFNNKEQQVTQLQIDNPMIQKYEVANKEGNLSSGSINHDKVKFVVRVPYSPAINTITFNKITDKHELIYLNQIILP